MKIAIIGPTHPYKGGISQHTTQLAHHLTAAGHEVELISWKNQYPFFYPGEQFVPTGKPEIPIFPSTKRVLSWRNPVGWAHWARRMKKFDEVIFIWFVPTIQGPVYYTMLKALGRSPARKVILCHNVIQHSPGPADKQLVRTVFKLADNILVHTEPLAETARQYTKTPVTVASMPAHFVGTPIGRRSTAPLHKRLLFFGLVRKYKGLDILLQALAKVPDVKLTVAGEMWGKQKLALEASIAQLKLGDRVTLQAGYVADSQVGALFGSADALVLPYRAGTGSWNADLGFYHGLPVIATRVGSFPKKIRDGVDGLLCEPGDINSLARAIGHFYEAGVAASLRAQVPKPSTDKDWQAYVDTLTHL